MQSLRQTLAVLSVSFSSLSLAGLPDSSKKFEASDSGATLPSLNFPSTISSKIQENANKNSGMSSKDVALWSSLILSAAVLWVLTRKKDSLAIKSTNFASADTKEKQVENQPPKEAPVISKPLAHKPEYLPITMEQIEEGIRCASEIRKFNERHENLSGLCDVTFKRKDRSAEFPDLPHHQAFDKAWKPALNSIGLGLSCSKEFTSDYAVAGSERVFHASFKLCVDNVPRVYELVQAMIESVKSNPRLESRQRYFGRLIAEACEANVAGAFELWNYGSTREFSQVLEKHSQALREFGRSIEADEIETYRALANTDLYAVRGYARFNRYCENQRVQAGCFWVSPHNWNSAYELASSLIPQFSDRPDLRPIADKILRRFESVVEALEDQAKNTLGQAENNGHMGALTEDDPCSGGLAEEQSRTSEFAITEAELRTLKQCLNKLRSKFISVPTVAMGNPLFPNQG